MVYEPAVESTMDLAREAARRGWPERSIFVCDYQTAGRGRQGRQWQAPPGKGLLFTVLLGPSSRPLFSTMLAAVALCEAVEALVRLDPAIKWPNDLLIQGRKLAGVLGEAYTGPPQSYALVGCGLNVNQDPADLEPIGRAATSLKLEAGRPLHRGELLVLCIERLAAWLGLPFDERERQLRYAWEYRLWGQGAEHRFRDAADEFSGRIEGVDLSGALLVRLADGTLRRLTSGELLLDSSAAR